MNVEFIEPASIELDDAIEYYNSQSPGFGEKFLEEVLQTINLIVLFPEAWSEVTKHTRKALLRKFPYNLIYTIHKKKIYILAVAHQHREPEYWIDRVIK
jgi:toxin ParE2